MSSSTFLAVGAGGIEYIRSSLLGGLSLAQSSVPKLAEGTALALVPAGTTAERAQDLVRGGLGKSTIDDLAESLVERYRDANLIVELPLWRPDDAGVIESDQHVLTCGSEVFAIAGLDGPADVISKTLRAADPSFMYNAFIVSKPMGVYEPGCPSQWIETGASKLLMLITGAYDGDGFILVPINK